MINEVAALPWDTYTVADLKTKGGLFTDLKQRTDLIYGRQAELKLDVEEAIANVNDLLNVPYLAAL